jgi:uncharacterized lipoprotein YbaY/uncharacterized membrane protein
MSIQISSSHAAALIFLATAACSDRSEQTLSGTVTYRERMALTPNATIRVALRDETVADQPTVIAETTFTAGTRQVPIEFTLPYSRNSVVRDRTYSLLAEIRQDDHLLFLTDEQYPVINNGRATDIELLLIRAQPSALTPDATGALSGRLFLSAEVLHFLPCGSDGQGMVLEDHTGGDAASVIRSLGGEEGGVTAMVRLDSNRLVAVRYAGNEGPSCEELPPSTEVEARGNEPFWFVSVSSGVATLRTPEQQAGVEYAGGNWTRHGGTGWRFAAIGAAGGVADSLSLELVDARCVDSMSGAHYPFTATLTVGGNIMTGCALEGRPAN